MRELKIYAVYHKNYAIAPSDFIQPIQVGKFFSKLDLGFASDDTGDNIAEKNKTYSELTALYWVWKNLPNIDSDYIGLCHYRRYFSPFRNTIKKHWTGNKILFDEKDAYCEEFSAPALRQVTGEDFGKQILRELKNGSIILPKANILTVEGIEAPVPIKTHYIYHHIKEDWYLMKEVVIGQHPEMAKMFDSFFENEKAMFCYNMFVASKSFLNDYCAWLFPILKELEEKVQLSGYAYQHRVFGFLSERLFNFYLHFHNLPTKEFPVVFFND